MKDVPISLSPLPPYVSLNFNFPVGKILKCILSRTSNHKLTSDFLAWCLQVVLADQYTEGYAAGAWSKRYPEYLKLVYDTEDIPEDISIHDSITISAWIGTALRRYSLAFPDENLTKAVLPRLDLLKSYLIRHYNSEIGGFGLSTGARLRGPVGINVDLRHTAWAVLTLWDLGFSDPETRKMLHKAGNYITDKLDTLSSTNEYAFTYAVLHRLLSTDDVSGVLALSRTSRRAKLKRIESILVEKFDPLHESWDLESEPVKEGEIIDNTIDILQSMKISSCIDQECQNIMKRAVLSLIKKLLELNQQKMALPFYDKDEPDIGATIQFLSIIIENQDVLEVKNEIIKRMSNFVVDPSFRKGKLKYSYPWHLASVFHVASLE